MAKMRKISGRASALLLVKYRMRAVASMRPNAAATEVFFARAMRTLASGGTTARKAWGSTTSCIDWENVSPIARDASAWPSETEFTPERTASQTKAEVYAVRAITPLMTKG